MVRPLPTRARVFREAKRFTVSQRGRTLLSGLVTRPIDHATKVTLAVLSAE